MAKLNRGLIVSCQAVKGEPLYGLDMERHFAKAAVLGGAVGIRTCYSKVVMQIKVGDIVLYNKYAGSDFKLDGEEVTILKQSDVLAIVEK